MNKKTMTAALLAGILLLAGCSQNNAPAAETTTEATTTTTTAAEVTVAEAEETTEKETEAEKTSEEETEASETEAPETEADKTEEAGGNDAPITGAETDEPFGETILETNVEKSFQEVCNKMKAVIDSGRYTYIMDSAMDYGDYTLNMSAVIAMDPELGTYSDINAVFMIMKNIQLPDGTLYIIDDDNKYYVKTTVDESGSTFSTDTDSALVPVKEDVTTADLVQLPTGEKLYRFTITPENNAAGSEYTSNIYVYFDTDGNVKNMAMNEGGYNAKITYEFRESVDASLFVLPTDYEEISYEEYQKRLMESLNLDSLYSDDSSEDSSAE